MKKKVKAIGAENISVQANTEATQLDPHAVASVWLDLSQNHVRRRKELFTEWLLKQGFSTNSQLEGTYKKVYAHAETNYVVKISKKGTGNTIPRKQSIRNLFLIPVYTDRHVMIQPKAAIDAASQDRAYSMLRKIVENEKLESYFKDRDFAPCNCGLHEGRPYIIDLSHRRGFTIEH